MPQQWSKDYCRGQPNQGQLLRCHPCPNKWKAFSVHKRETHHCMYTNKLTTHLLSREISLNPSTSICHKYCLTRNIFTNPKTCTRMHLIKLSYKETTPDALRASHRNHQRNIMWFNPPYIRNVETKVRKCFFSLVD